MYVTFIHVFCVSEAASLLFNIKKGNEETRFRGEDLLSRETEGGWVVPARPKHFASVTGLMFFAVNQKSDRDFMEINIYQCIASTSRGPVWPQLLRFSLHFFHSHSHATHSYHWSLCDTNFSSPPISMRLWILGFFGALITLSSSYVFVIKT